MYLACMITIEAALYDRLYDHPDDAGAMAAWDYLVNVVLP